jgi:hypothetical protein
MELLSGHEKIITKSGISLNAGTLNRGFTVFPSVKLRPRIVDHCLVYCETLQIRLYI